MASEAIRNSQAAPSDKRTPSKSRGNTCGSTTRVAICQLEASSVCAFTNCSRGNSRTRCSMSRINSGAVPSTMSATLASSPTPKTMNRIGRMANGGIIDSARTKDDPNAPNHGSSPFSTPTPRPIAAATPTPMPRRPRLDAVSFQNRYSPLRRSGAKASRSTASATLPMPGRSLSLGFSANRALDAKA